MVGFEGGGASFAQKCFGLTKDAGGGAWIGTVVLPGAPPRGSSADATSTTGGLGDSLDPADPLNSACNIFMKKGGRGGSSGSGGASQSQSGSVSTSTGDRSSSSSSSNAAEAAGGEDESGDSGTHSPSPPSNATEEDHGGVAVALCGYRVPPRQADAWARALLGAVDAEVVVALATVAAEPGRSEGWPGARLVATAEAEAREECLKVIKKRNSNLLLLLLVVVLVRIEVGDPEFMLDELRLNAELLRCLFLGLETQRARLCTAR